MLLHRLRASSRATSGCAGGSTRDEQAARPPVPSACSWRSPRWSPCPPPRAPPATAATSPAADKAPRGGPGVAAAEPPRWRTPASPPCWTARAPLSSSRLRGAAPEVSRPATSSSIPLGRRRSPPPSTRSGRSSARTRPPPSRPTKHRVPHPGERRDRPAGRRPPRRLPGHPGHAAERRDRVRARGADLAALQLGPVVHRRSRGSSRRSSSRSRSCSWCAPGCARAPGTGACRP